jgi:putative hydrolase of the HAD superfamily
LRGRAEHSLRRLKICQVGPGPGVEVDAIVDSGVVGVAKPDPEIFAYALAALGVEPENAAYVGDSCRLDLAGAEAAGIRSFHFDPYTICDLDRHEHLRSLWDLLVEGRWGR